MSEALWDKVRAMETDMTILKTQLAHVSQQLESIQVAIRQVVFLVLTSIVGGFFTLMLKLGGII